MVDRNEIVSKLDAYVQGSLAMDSRNPNQPDPHRQHAARMYGVPYDEVTLAQRQAAKVDRYQYLYRSFHKKEAN